ncbi:hypothetical protein GO495_10450 [Chitinophaga oryziterrae]|uniref:Zinc-finger domain-containing protein n=1 Tax=Chitinophaga oryziterrae TaxID=1031224 RepID=A0A6N8J8S2_9BACT|nr:hypothetical protein [Chitinophaga oryziterrae]MVT41001.1 hypothetical protein [Chitinophaga oryziterrae]
MEYERYISDGILEKYFLGFATPEEKRELEIHLSIFPELQTEMDAVERRIERAAFKDAALPPAHIKSALMQQIAAESVDEQTYSYNIKYNTVTAPSSNYNMSVHIGWKIVLIALLSMIALSVLAAIVFYLAAMQK